MYRLLLGCVLLVGCGDNLVARLSDHDAGPIDSDAEVGRDGDAGDTGQGRTIGGTALGIRGAVQVDVTVGNSAVSHVTVTQDGTWAFPSKFTAGATYTVTTADPDCAIVGGTGLTSAIADVANVALYCIGVVELASVDFDPHVIRLAPAFQPAAAIYSGTRPLFMEPSDPLSITAVASYPGEAVIHIHDVVVASGQPSAAAPMGNVPLSIVVTHGATSLTRTYEISPAPSERLESYIKASDSSAGIGFSGGAGTVGDTGCGLTANGNGVALGSEVLVVGAPCENGGAGAAYVYRRSDTTWTFEAKLAPAGLAAGDQFGASVAVDNDVIVVGAPYDDATRSSSGAVYVFQRTPFAIAPWSNAAKLKASNAGADDNFGLALAMSGDTIVVGAPAEDSSATGVGGNGQNDKYASAGAAYVYVHDSVAGTWPQQAYLKASNTDANDLFGTAVSISGDRIVIGAPGEDGPTDTDTNAGAAYVFVRAAPGTWTQEGIPLHATNLDAGDDFGRSVSIAGDRIAVGAPREDGDGSDPADDSAPDAGATYVFARSGGSWSEEQYLKPTTVTAGDKAGSAVALDADHLVIGALEAMNRAGAVFAWRRASVTIPYWNDVRTITAPNAESGDVFGASLAVHGDTFAVGAFKESSAVTGVAALATDNGAPGAGAVYVFR